MELCVYTAYSSPNPHGNENPIYVFLIWELNGLSPNFHIHVSVSYLYIPRIGPHISCNRIGRLIVGIYHSQTHECGNWECGRAIPFLGIFVFGIFSIGSLQCCPAQLLGIGVKWEESFTYLALTRRFVSHNCPYSVLCTSFPVKVADKSDIVQTGLCQVAPPPPPPRHIYFTLLCIFK
jgi:hypothetical protein